MATSCDVEALKAEFHDALSKLKQLSAEHCEAESLTKTLIIVKTKQFLDSVLKGGNLEEEGVKLARELRDMKWLHTNTQPLAALTDNFTMLCELVTTYAPEQEDEKDSDSDDDDSDEENTPTDILAAISTNIQKPMSKSLGKIVSAIPDAKSRTLAQQNASQITILTDKLVDAFKQIYETRPAA